MLPQHDLKYTSFCITQNVSFYQELPINKTTNFDPINIGYNVLSDSQRRFMTRGVILDYFTIRNLPREQLKCSREQESVLTNKYNRCLHIPKGRFREK